MDKTYYVDHVCGNITPPPYNDTIKLGIYEFEPKDDITNIETVRICQLITGCVLGFQYVEDYIEKYNLQRHFKVEP